MRLILCLALGAPGLLNGGSLLDFSYGVLEQRRGNEKEAEKFFSKAYEADPTSMPLVRRIVGFRMGEEDRRRTC